MIQIVWCKCHTYLYLSRRPLHSRYRCGRLSTAVAFEYKQQIIIIIDPRKYTQSLISNIGRPRSAVYWPQVVLVAFRLCELFSPVYPVKMSSCVCSTLQKLTFELKCKQSLALSKKNTRATQTNLNRKIHIACRRHYTGWLGTTILFYNLYIFHDPSPATKPGRHAILSVNSKTKSPP